MWLMTRCSFRLKEQAEECARNWKPSSLVQQLVIKYIVKHSYINENSVNFYRFIFRHKLYARPAVPRSWGMTVIISQECVINLNRERVGPRRETTGENRWRIERESKKGKSGEFRARAARCSHRCRDTTIYNGN